MEEKKNKKPIIIGVAVTLLVTLTLLGVTYAYYRTRIIGNQNDTSISVTSKKLEITYSDDNAVVTATGISPGGSAVKKFKVSNTGTAESAYSLKFEILENTFQRNMDWTYELKQNSNGIIASGMIRAGGEQTILFDESLAINGVDDYTLTIKYADSTDDQSVDMGASLKIKVDIDNVVNYWNNAEDGTLLAAIKSDNTVKSPVTTPGLAPSSSTEAVLASTEDDYGTSYYYRGAVKNNYVNFEGMCWRIVRVQGDGNIKIILVDENNECKNVGSKGTFISDSNGDAIMAMYERNSSVVPYEQSDIVNLTEAWLNGGTYTYYDDYMDPTSSVTGTFTKKMDTSKLVDTEWCSDLSIEGYYDVDWNLTNKENAYRYGYGYIGRMDSPSLECSFTGLESSFTYKYVSKIGMLTADEMIFAGADDYTTSSNTFTYYLTEYFGNEYYWTMTPESTYVTNGEVFLNINAVFSSGGNSGYLSGDNIPYPVRPVVVLSSDVTIVDGGTGTQTNPYVIN